LNLSRFFIASFNISFGFSISRYQEDRWGIPLTRLPCNIYVPVQTRIYVSILTVISMLRLFKCYFQQYFSYIVFWRIFFWWVKLQYKYKSQNYWNILPDLTISEHWHVFCQKQERLTLHKHLRSKRFFWVGSTVLPIFLVFCIMFFFYILLVSGAQCCLCLLIAPSVFSNVYSWASCFMLDEWFMLSLEIRLTVAIYFVIHDINLVINSMWTSSLECWTKS
jgi:hypothetical protein